MDATLCDYYQIVSSTGPLSITTTISIHKRQQYKKISCQSVRNYGNATEYKLRLQIRELQVPLNKHVPIDRAVITQRRHEYGGVWGHPDKLQTNSNLQATNQQKVQRLVRLSVAMFLCCVCSYYLHLKKYMLIIWQYYASFSCKGLQVRSRART